MNLALQSPQDESLLDKREREGGPKIVMKAAKKLQQQSRGEQAPGSEPARQLWFAPATGTAAPPRMPGEEFVLTGWWKERHEE